MRFLIYFHYLVELEGICQEILIFDISGVNHLKNGRVKILKLVVNPACLAILSRRSFNEAGSL